MLSTEETRDMAAEVIAKLLTASYEAIDISELSEALNIDLDQALSVLYEVGTANAAIYWDEDDEDVSFDPLADVRVGDADPMECADDDDCCAASRFYMCTRLEGHPGSHIAGDGDDVLDVWDQ